MSVSGRAAAVSASEHTSISQVLLVKLTQVCLLCSYGTGCVESGHSQIFIVNLLLQNYLNTREMQV